jgi:putative N-acetyltransferase (TIGR04045 family)
MTLLDVSVLTGAPAATAPSLFAVRDADAGALATYRRLRQDVFVDEQGIFSGSDLDEVDDDPRTVVLVAMAPDGTVLGGVRLAPAVRGADIGWWTGGRLVVDRRARGTAGIGQALVRAACERAEREGVLRFEATVQPQNERLFTELGWVHWADTAIGGRPHLRMRYPIDRIQRLAASSKAFLADLLEPYSAWSDSAPASLGGPGFVGDDGAPVPGTDVIAACDAILPALIDRDPEWAGWCAVLVNVNDLAAMGATPVGMMNAIGARNASVARRVMNGLRSGAQAWGVPVLGGHTQIGVSAALSVTALGRTGDPVPGGGGRYGDALSLTMDLAGGWRRGFEGAQWDSTSARAGEELRSMQGMVAAARPNAAKDVSMAGIVGTVGMLAEASGYGAVIDVLRIPSPASGATTGDWLTCFPGFGMVTTDRPGASRMRSALTTTAEVGALTVARGIALRWPDGNETSAIASTVTGLGRA